MVINGPWAISFFFLDKTNSRTFNIILCEVFFFLNRIMRYKFLNFFHWFLNCILFSSFTNITLKIRNFVTNKIKKKSLNFQLNKPQKKFWATNNSDFQKDTIKDFIVQTSANLTVANENIYLYIYVTVLHFSF